MKYTVPGIALLSMFVLANCGGGGSSPGNASCRSTYQHYLDCGLFEGGYLGTCHSQPETELDRCVAACANDSTCQELEDFACRADLTPCLEDCYDTPFECHNGREIAAGHECDGFDDCHDFSDEEDCDLAKFRCDEFSAFGEVIGGGQVCDLHCDCGNCSDEDECGVPTCTN